MPRILLLSTGGTIASTEASAGGPIVAKLGGDALLAGLNLPPEMVVTVESLPAKDSSALTLQDLAGFAAILEKHMAAYDGFVITHGTDTMEDTAYGLELLLAPQKPVVITGSQRHAGEADSDGPRNLRDALFAASQPELGRAGVVVLFEGDIHAARHVHKAHTSRVDAFRSGDFGKLGAVDGHRLHLRYLPERQAALGLGPKPVPVALISAAMGAVPDLLHALLPSAYQAVVLVGFGRGNFPDGWAAASAALIAAGKAVVVSTRCEAGTVRPVYGADSGGSAMANLGAGFGGDLAPGKLRLLLAFGLSRMALAPLLQLYAPD